jgi:hypothetical protein
MKEILVQLLILILIQILNNNFQEMFLEMIDLKDLNIVVYEKNISIVMDQLIKDNMNK